MSGLVYLTDQLCVDPEHIAAMCEAPVGVRIVLANGTEFIAEGLSLREVRNQLYPSGERREQSP